MKRTQKYNLGVALGAIGVLVVLGTLGDAFPTSPFNTIAVAVVLLAAGYVLVNQNHD